MPTDRKHAMELLTPSPSHKDLKTPFFPIVSPEARDTLFWGDYSVVDLFLFVCWVANDLFALVVL